MGLKCGMDMISPLVNGHDELALLQRRLAWRRTVSLSLWWHLGVMPAGLDECERMISKRPEAGRQSCTLVEAVVPSSAVATTGESGSLRKDERNVQQL